VSLKSEQKVFLEQSFGERANFNLLERKLYGHDIAAIPNLIKPLIGNTTPDGVVQPQSEEELIALVKWAVESKIPLTPRGKASSGYGGAVPVKNGIVVDFYRMKSVKNLDAEAQTVTVEPGITWEQLDEEIKHQGYTLRLYPTSYPSSTAGGWLAQGGAGIGSYEYGYFKENVISARVVQPNGEVREFSDEDLGLVADAEGITGFITEITLRIQPLEDIEVLSIATHTPLAMQQLVTAITDAALPIWSMVFINPRMAELKNRAPVREHYGHPAEERVLLPAAYIISLAYRKSDEQEILNGAEKIVKEFEAEVLSDRIAEHEWEHRFKLMVVKRLGPSLVPTEVIVPLSKLGKVMDEIEHQVDQPIVKEGVVIRDGEDGEPEVVILGFIPSDQRKFSYNFVFSLVLTILKIAEKHGGRGYATGLYFSKRANQILGKDRVKQFRKYKSDFDPYDIMNPKKVIGNGLLGTALDFAGTVEPMIRPFGNHVVTKVGEHPSEDVRDIPADVAWYAYSCSQCGYCVNECDQFYGRGWESQSPRGKWFWLREYMEGREEWNQFMVDTILSCTTCELCDFRCSAALPIQDSWMDLRGKLIQEDKKMTFPPFEMMSAALEAEGDIWAGYRRDRDNWFPEDLKEKHGPGHRSENVYFAGCTASYVEKDIGEASVRLLDEADVDFTYLGKKENCCATPMLVAGKWDLFTDTMKKNIAAVKNAGGKRVITSCPACDMMWRKVYPEWAEKMGIEYDIETRHYSEVVAEKIGGGEFTFPDNNMPATKVTWHDSCHIGRVSGIYEEPRDLIKAIPNVEFEDLAHNRDNAHCCGSVLTLLKEPDVAADIGDVKLQEAADIQAEKILALCPCCEFQLRLTRDEKKRDIEVVDLAHFAAEALGYELPEPDEEVRAQWAVFEAMINLMTPEGFAALMDSMWPELIDAMPMKMGKMMKGMGKIPGALTLMKPMFPILFPRLLPFMMPKVMATMLDLVSERIPMPHYMEEQMPELMPKVMDNLMPHMIDDVVPLVTDPMIRYLRGTNGKANQPV